MAAETLTATQGGDKIVPQGAGYAGNVKAAWGKYTITTAALEDGDIFEMCWLPPNALVLGGNFTVGDLDTGTETVDIDVGWAANTGQATYVDQNGTTWDNSGASASATGFVNSGVLTGDAITDLLAAGSNMRPFPMATGPLLFTGKTQVQIEVNAAQATPAQGVATVVVYYVLI